MGVRRDAGYHSGRPYWTDARTRCPPPPTGEGYLVEVLGRWRNEHGRKVKAMHTRQRTLPEIYARAAGLGRAFTAYQIQLRATRFSRACCACLALWLAIPGALAVRMPIFVAVVLWF